MSVIHNERTKLTATYLNGVAITVLAVGGFAPVANAMNAQSLVTVPVVISAAICLFHLGRITFGRKTYLERITAMTSAQFLSLMIMPIGGLAIAGFMLFITRKDRRDPKAR